MIVLDTHVWLWWLNHPSLLSSRARREIESGEPLGVSAMSCYEIARLADTGRITLDRDARSWLEYALAEGRIEALYVDQAIATAASLLDRDRFPGDPNDRLIFATAVAHGATLLTKDRRLRDFDGDRAIW